MNILKLFQKEQPKPPTPWERLMKFKGWLSASVLIMSAFTYWYSFLAPDYTNFKERTEIVAALYPTGALQLVVQANQIPDIPVTVIVTDGKHEIFHQHYHNGIPEVEGNSCNFGSCIIEYVEQLSFAPSNGHLEVKFVFNNYKTLFRDNYTIWKVPLNLMELDPDTNNTSWRQQDDTKENNPYLNPYAPGVWV